MRAAYVLSPLCAEPTYAEPLCGRCADAPYALGAYVLSRLCTEFAYVPSPYVAAYVLGA